MFNRIDRERVRVAVEFTDSGLTKQAHKDECDVNKIVKRFEKTGVLAHTAAQQAMYGDFSPIDYREALDTVIKAQEAFAQLPARVRAQFGNDPGAFVDAAGNPENRKLFEELGLIEAVDGDGLGKAQPVTVDGLASPQGAQ